MRPTTGLLLTAALIACAHGAYAHDRHAFARPVHDLASANLDYKTLMNAAFARPSGSAWSGASPAAPSAPMVLSHDAARPPALLATSTSPRSAARSRPTPASRPLPAFSLPDEGFALAGAGPAAWSASGGRYAVDFAPARGWTGRMPAPPPRPAAWCAWA
jgi:hypothetical protein